WRGRRDKETDFFNVRRRMWNRNVDEPIDTNPRVKESGNKCVLQVYGGRAREIRMQIVCAEPSALCAKLAGIFRQGRGPQNHWICFVTNVHQPNKFRGVRTLFQ